MFVQEAFSGVDFTASGLQAVALVIQRCCTRRLEFSNLLNAPLLECLELDLNSTPTLSAEINVQRHDKPFQFTLASRQSDQHSRDERLAWQTLEEGFGPQE